MKETIANLPEEFERYSDMMKVTWIQHNYGVYDDEEGILKGLRDDTPEDLIRVYNDCFDRIDKYHSEGVDVD